MFSGIVQGTAEVVTVIEREGMRSHRIRLPAEQLSGLQIGASLAHNGCCLTVTAMEGELLTFDLIAETLRITNLGELRPGDRVNYERATRLGEEIGGHLMSGHILTCAEVLSVETSPNNRRLWLQLPDRYAKYLFPKGYIAIDGISLTIGEVEQGRFSVNLIPETLERTNIASRTQGDRVNIEIDPQTQVIVDSVERILQQQAYPLRGAE